MHLVWTDIKPIY